jgi:hypothetical protein
MVFKKRSLPAESNSFFCDERNVLNGAAGLLEQVFGSFDAQQFQMLLRTLNDLPPKKMVQAALR